MPISLNEVLVAGTLARDPTTAVQASGPPVTTARLCIAEARDGQTYRLWVDLEAFGKTGPGTGRPACWRRRPGEGQTQMEELGKRRQEAREPHCRGLECAGPGRPSGRGA